MTNIRLNFGFIRVCMILNQQTFFNWASFFNWPFPRRRSPITESTREVLFFLTGVFPHAYLRAFTSETHAQVSETARTGTAAGHSGESGRERRHVPFGGLSPCRDHTIQHLWRIFATHGLPEVLVSHSLVVSSRNSWHGMESTTYNQHHTTQLQMDWLNELYKHSRTPWRKWHLGILTLHWPDSYFIIGLPHTPLLACHLQNYS